MKKHILLVENDHLLRQVLMQALGAVYQCTASTTLARTYDLLEHQAFDAVVLDRVLDDGDGLELVSYLHEYAYATQVVVISMLKNWQEKVQGLHLGADDYLPKPFAVQELLARLDRALSHQKLAPRQAIEAGPYRLFAEQGLVEFDGVRIQLRKKESQILACLLLHKNRTVSRSAIIQHVWKINAQAPQFDTLEVYVRRLRIALQEMGKHIKTVRGFGYRFDAPTARTNAREFQNPAGSTDSLHHASVR